MSTPGYYTCSEGLDITRALYKKIVLNEPDLYKINSNIDLLRGWYLIFRLDLSVFHSRNKYGT